MNRPLWLLVLLAAGLAGPVSAAEPKIPFSQWLDGVRQEAKAAGMTRAFLDAALAGAKPIKRVVELDRRQPEFTLTFWNYLNKSVNAARIARGREMLAKHRALLQQTARRFGVQTRFIVAFWGLESNYGKYTGAFPLIGAVATLAHDPRRSRFFRGQLLAALTIMSRGDVPLKVKGSWAGAMGNFQFIPTTYKDFAVDADGDGRRDLWNNFPDMFSSAANYLQRSGWRRGWSWGREVKISPPGHRQRMPPGGIQRPRFTMLPRFLFRRIPGWPISWRLPGARFPSPPILSRWMRKKLKTGWWLNRDFVPRCRPISVAYRERKMRTW